MPYFVGKCNRFRRFPADCAKKRIRHDSTHRPCYDNGTDSLFFGKKDLDIHDRALTAAAVQARRAASVRVNCRTVDQPADGARLAEWGVDFITSNILE